jgi:hypothetical protein
VNGILRILLLKIMVLRRICRISAPDPKYAELVQTAATFRGPYSVIPNEEGSRRSQIEAVEANLSTLERDTTMTKFSAFLKDEAGAVTVDWVVLTAAVVGLGLLIFTFIRPAVASLATGIAAELGDAQACMESNGTGATC